MIPYFSSYLYYNQYYNINPYYYLSDPVQSDQNQNKSSDSKVKQQQKETQEKIQENLSKKKLQIQLGVNQLSQKGYQKTKKLWTQDQDKLLITSIQQKKLNWKEIVKFLPNRNLKMCYNRYKRICKAKKVLWTKQQDEKLKYFVQEKKMKWRNLQQHFKNRKAKQLRQRYLNFLRPNISRQPWTVSEDLKIIQCVNKIGKKWKKIQEILINRSQNQIKNRYYGRIKLLLNKKQIKQTSQ